MPQSQIRANGRRIYRIDGLGRIMIPVQLRREGGLQTGDPLICTWEDGAIVYRLAAPDRRYTREEAVQLLARAAQRQGVKLDPSQIDQMFQAVEDEEIGALMRQEQQRTRGGFGS